MTTTSLAILACLAVSGPLPGNGAINNGGGARIEPCIVSLIEDIDVPAEENGPLVSVGVEEGDFVQRGALLAQIDDRQALLQKEIAELKRDVAQEKAATDLDIKISEKTLGVAEAELEQNQAINRQRPGVVPETEMRRLKLTADRAGYQVDKSKVEMKVAKMEAEAEVTTVQAAEQNIQRRRILSPIDGNVVTIYHERGEWVSAGEPVIRVVRMDQLRVEGFLRASDFNPGEIHDKSVTVEVELARGRKVEFKGKVVFVSPLVQAGNKYRVRAVVANRTEQRDWLLRPGMSAVMTIQVEP